MYEQGRFLTCTGDHIEGTSLVIEHRQDEINEIHRQIFGKEKNQEPTPTPIRPSLSLSDDEIITRARNAKNGDTI